MATVSLDFTQAGLDNAMVSFQLDSEYGIMTRCGMHCAPRAHKTLGTFPQGTVRFAFGHRNTPQEVDTCLEALETILAARGFRWTPFLRALPRTPPAFKKAGENGLGVWECAGAPRIGRAALATMQGNAGENG